MFDKRRQHNKIRAAQPIRPSAFDLEHAWPWYSYLIVSVENGAPKDAHSWRLAEDRSRFEPEDLELAAPEVEPGPERKPQEP